MIAVLAAPSNLGLRPPQATSVPGCAKAPEALREAGLHARLLAAGAVDAGVVLPRRYLDDVDPDARRLRNQEAIIDHSRRLADRLGALLTDGHAPLVLGGDCRILVGAGLALARRASTAWSTSTDTPTSATPGTATSARAWPVRTSRPPSGTIGPPSPTSTATGPTSRPAALYTSAAATPTSTSLRCSRSSVPRSLQTG